MGFIEPAGREGEWVTALLGWMTAGGLVIWLAVVSLAIYATFLKSRPISSAAARRLVLWGGAILPTAILVAVLAYGLALLPPVLAAAPEGSLRVRVVGEQWWWRMQIVPPRGPPVEVANELWLPVGLPVALELEARDVIHSLWIPEMGVKMDMIPGRTTRLTLNPTRTGEFRGICAEYCGASHALMLFAVRVVPQSEFAEWIDRQRQPAEAPATPLAARGRETFLSSGCGACHAVRGTPADGQVGPDLTHVGGRRTVPAGRLAAGRTDLHRWIAEPRSIKPGARMPAFGMLPEEDLRAMAAYLEGLR